MPVPRPRAMTVSAASPAIARHTRPSAHRAAAPLYSPLSNSHGNSQTNSVSRMIAHPRHASSSTASRSPNAPPPLYPPPQWSPDVVRPHAHKSMLDLINSYAVFRACQIPQLVDWTPWLLETAAKVGATPLAHAVVKRTFFKHFCGGENINEVLPTMAAFKGRGIGSILDLAMEADLDAAALSGEPARLQAAKIASLMKESVDLASQHDDACIAAKVTAFVPPAVLLRWTNTLNALKQAFAAADADGNGKLSLEELHSMSVAFPALTNEELGKLFAAIPGSTTAAGKKVDWIDVSDTFSLGNPDACRLLLVSPPPNATPESLPATAADLETSHLVLAEFASVLTHAKEKKVRVMIDAEQSYFQPAIDDVALHFSRTLNPRIDDRLPRAVVLNTYQMYLRDALDRLVQDLHRAARSHRTFGVKIVRGAYMVGEAERAAEMGYTNPVHPSIADTHGAYNAAISLLVARLPDHPVSVVVASHNQQSVLRAIAELQRVGVKNPDVAFAQLMGMQDGTTYALASQGFKAYKYIPYGPIEVTVPYLLRRAQENASVLGGVAEDRLGIADEIRRRVGITQKNRPKASPANVTSHA